MSENNLSEIFSSAIAEIREFADAETIVGEPISVGNGTSVIPISKVSMGFASGGLDLTKRGDPLRHKNFGGGSGTGVSITPVAFLVSSADGRVEIMPVVPAKAVGTIDKIAALIEHSPTILGDLKDVLTPDRVKKEREQRPSSPEK